MGTGRPSKSTQFSYPASPASKASADGGISRSKVNFPDGSPCCLRSRPGPSDAPRNPLFYDWPCAGSRLRCDAHRAPNPLGGALKAAFITCVHERERPFSRDFGADRRECSESDRKVDLAIRMLTAA